KHGIVVGAGPDSTVLSAALDALGPDDSLTVVSGAATEDVRDYVRLAGAWVEQRTRVVESLVDIADPADAIVTAEPLTGSADEARAELETLAKHLRPGGVVSVAVAAAPFLAGGAGEELARQNALFGVGADTVLRS